MTLRPATKIQTIRDIVREVKSFVPREKYVFTMNDELCVNIAASRFLLERLKMESMAKESPSIETNPAIEG